MEAPPPKPPPAPTSEIRVSQMQPAAPKPEGPKSETPARDRMMKGLREKAGIKEEERPGAQPEVKPETISPPQTDGQSQPAEGEQPGATSTPTAPGSTPKAPKEKANPWKLVDDYKKRAATLEQELLEAKKSILPEQDRKTYEERAQKIEARNKELEDEIRYVNYAKSQDFQEKYQAPYEAAFKRAIADISEIAVTDPNTQQSRPATIEDFMLVLNQPLGPARQMAQAIFGDFANDVMTHRKEVKGLWDAQQAALKEAKENGSKRDAERQQKMSAQQQALATEIKQAWDKENQTLLEHPEYGKYFKPREGNEEFNKRLSEGYRLVDQAFSENPNNPALTPEQRSAIIKRHTAVRNRAAAWGVANWEKEQAIQRVAELEKELKAYKETTPATAGTEPGTQIPGASTAREQMFQKLRQLAK